MLSLSSPTVRVALIAGGGLLVIVSAALAIVILYCCSCQRRRKSKKKNKARRRQKPAGLEEEGEGGGGSAVKLVSYSGRQPMTTHPSSLTLDQFRGSTDTIPTFTSELTSLSLSRLDSTDGLLPPLPHPPRPLPRHHPQSSMSSLSTHLELLEVQMRTPHSRRVAADGVESELEISQKTWSAYESLPRGLTRLPIHQREEEEGEGRGKEARWLRKKVEEEEEEEEEMAAWLPGEGEKPEREKKREEEMDIEDNDAYSSSMELESLRQQASAEKPDDNDNDNPAPSRFNFLFPRTHSNGPTHHHRFSTVSTVSSNSGYVISSLNSPVALNSPRERDRTSCYSTGSEGYVINSLEWATTNTGGSCSSSNSGRPTGLPQLRPPLLPRIIEGTPTTDYLHIVAS